MVALLKTSTLVALLAAMITATPIEKRHDKYFVHQLQAAKVPRFDKRDDLIDFDDTEVRYTADLQIGSSKESVTVMIDTGSLRLNVPGPGAKCLVTATCPAGTVFHPDQSNTFHNLSVPYVSYYGSGETSVKGYTVHDNIFFDNGDEIPQFEFDVANSTSFEMGWFGVRHQSNPNASYVVAAKNAGLVNHAGFSLYLGPDDKTGTFIVGGVDKAKYEGELAFYDTDYFFQGKSITTANGTVLNFPNELALDTGSAGLILDPAIVEQIFKEVSDKNGKISCDIALNGDKSFTFDLGQGVKIDVPYSDAFYWNSDKTKCNTRIEKTGHHGATQNVGIPLIKHIYLTHNYDTGKLGVAPVKHTDESNIVDFWF